MHFGEHGGPPQQQPHGGAMEDHHSGYGPPQMPAANTPPNATPPPPSAESGKGNNEGRICISNQFFIFQKANGMQRIKRMASKNANG